MLTNRFHLRSPTLFMLALGGLALPSLAHAAPQLAFDSFDGGTKKSFRGPGSAPGATIVVDTEVTITRISVLNDLWVSSNLKFVIFNKTTDELVYVSPPAYFIDEGETWKTSESLAVVLVPGVEYEIGAIGNTIATWNFDEMPTKAGGFRSTGVNPNFASFTAPYVLSHGLADAAVRLYVDNPDCGDGIVDLGEACDDANPDNSDACTTACANATCGDGFTWIGQEECDDGNWSNYDACLPNCVNATCGDGHLWLGQEACDDANQDNTDLCTNACNPAQCGDGFVQPGEACDDGNLVDDDKCSNHCVPDTCGNGSVQGDEECDDGNSDNSDGCTNACTLPACGDGEVQAPEACDDGNPLNDDMCLNDCVEASCGDGYINANSEECDDANDVENDGCTNSCKLPTCGDGIIQGDEECDDGNDIDSDTCDNLCALGDAETSGPAESGGTEEDTGETEETGTEGTTGEGGTEEETGEESGDEGQDTEGPALDDGYPHGCGSCSATEGPARGVVGLMALLALLGIRRRRAA